jgi:DNA replication and repair protein RecF
VTGHRGAVPVQAEVDLSTRSGKRIRLNGAALGAAEELRSRSHALVVTPDRLAVVKRPAARRAYFDRVLGRLSPARAALPSDYGTAVGQRNACLRRIAAGASTPPLEPWTERVVALGVELSRPQARGRAALPGFRGAGGRVGPRGLDRVRRRPWPGRLHERLARDVERGTTGLGPHLDEFLVLSGDRDLRSFGSQGEQRLAVLSLLLAEAELLTERGAVPPLLLLDDALSELDGDRRRVLSGRLGATGQTLVTATGAEALPLAPAQLLVVSAGEVREG